MNWTNISISILRPRNCVLLVSILSMQSAAAGSGRVILCRTPDGGIQPQAALDSKSALHLIYYKGNPRAGDIFYVRREAGQDTFSKPIRVNCQAGSAIAAGSIRGAHLAIGRNGRVHAAWMGGEGAVRASVNGMLTTPMVYTRMRDDGLSFEPEKNVLTFAAGLDGGGSVAADPQGNVYVVWHASPPGNLNGEAGRAVFVARSRDEGKTFEREKQANLRPTGACGCCGLRAFADAQGVLYVLYRAASEKVNRDEILLISRDRGNAFEIANADKWVVNACPMSSAFLDAGETGALAAWETDGQVYGAAVDGKTLKVSKSISPPGAAKRKHPVAAQNAKGEMLLAWTEGTAWEKGGAVSWQVFDRHGQPEAEKGSADGVPVWSLVAAYAKPDGTFVIVY